MRPFYRLLLLALIPAMIGCREPTLKDLLDAERSGVWNATVDAPRHTIEFKEISRTTEVLRRSGLPDSARLTLFRFDSLAKAAGIEGLTVMMRISPKDSQSRSGFSADLIYGDRTGFASFQEALQAYQFGLKSRIWLEVGGKRLPLGNYQMENTFGMTASRTFTLVFPPLPESAHGRCQLVLDDIVPGAGRTKLAWNGAKRINPDGLK